MPGHVVIEVNDGIAEVVEKPAGVEVHILDFDEHSADELVATVEPADKAIEADPCGRRTGSDHEEYVRCGGRAYCNGCGGYVDDQDPTDPVVRYYHGDSFDDAAGPAVTVLIWSHKHGRDVTVYASLEVAERAGAAIVARELEDAIVAGGGNACGRIRRALDAGRHKRAIRLYHELLAGAEDDIRIETLPVVPDSAPPARA